MAETPPIAPGAGQHPAIGYSVLVTWPEVQDGKHRQDVWYAYLSDQAEAVRAVLDASGALNDAKVELLGPMEESDFHDYEMSPGSVRKAPRSSITSSP